MNLRRKARADRGRWSASRGGGRVEIREGLAENDKVVVSANFLIDAESNLKAALNGLDSGEKSQ